MVVIIYQNKKPRASLVNWCGW